MDVSFVIVNYNTTALVEQCIQSIYLHTRKVSFEIILVDNASTDKSIIEVKNHFPELIFIANAENIGFGKANNVGISCANGKYVFLINSDTYLLNDVTEVFVDFMEKKPVAGCCGGDLFNEKNERQVAFGNFPSLLEVLSQIGFGIFYREYYNRHISSGVRNYDDKIKEVDYISGADMFIRKSVLERIGSFDPDFFLYYEETELAYRMKKAGYLSFVVPDAKIVHLEGGSQQVDKVNYCRMAVYAKSRNLFFKKCYGNGIAFVAKLLYTLQAVLNYPRNGKGNLYRILKIIIQS